MKGEGKQGRRKHWDDVIREHAVDTLDLYGMGYPPEYMEDESMEYDLEYLRKKKKRY